MSRTQRICFQDSQGKMLFCILDGGFIRLLYENGERYFSICRYLDEEHAEIDGVIILFVNICGGWRETELSVVLYKYQRNE